MAERQPRASAGPSFAATVGDQDTLHLQAYLEFAVGDFAEAARVLNRAIAAYDNDTRLLFDLGVTLWSAGDRDAAEQAFAQVLVLDPGNAAAHFNLAAAATRRALAYRHLRLALQHDPLLAARCVAAALAHLFGRHVSILQASAWRIASRELPAVHDAVTFGFMKRGNFRQAADSCRKALALEPTHQRYTALGMALAKFDSEAAVAAFNQALALNSQAYDAEEHLGIQAEEVKNFAKARTHFENVVKHSPRPQYAYSRLLFLDSIEGRFDDAERHFGNMVDAVTRSGLESVHWELLATIAYRTIMWPMPRARYRAMTQAIDEQITRDALARGGPLVTPGRRTRNPGRQRIGYLSSCFRDHPIGHITSGLFAAHDRTRFEVHAYYTHVDTDTDYTRAIRAGVEHFHHVSGTVGQLTELIRSHDLDLLIYLDGYMVHNLMQVVALRPARIQAYWTGHAGGLELSCIDYLIADSIVVPPGEDRLYQAKVVKLPNAFTVATPGKIGPPPSRLAAGLPETGFVYCGFNNPEKVDRRIFDAWMRILAATENSVLWLSAGSLDVYAETLRCEAEKKGVSGDRLIFAKRVMSKADYFARLQHADVYLDTLLLNGATMALDALWTGVPLLTVHGDRFSSRIATTFAITLGMPEMVCATLQDYERRAIAFAHDRAPLVELRTRLQQNLRTRPLFQVDTFCRDFETSLERIITDETDRSLN